MNKKAKRFLAVLGLYNLGVFGIILVWSLSITVSTTGFHPVNAGSTPAEITMWELGASSDAFLVGIYL